MEPIVKAHDRLEKKANLKRGIEDVQTIINNLKTARSTIQTNPESAPITLAKLQSSVKQGFEKVNEDLTEVTKGLNAYSKALDKKFEKKTLPFADDNTFSSQSSLVNRAIAMHLLREGHFDVATHFISEANANPPSTNALAGKQSSTISPLFAVQNNTSHTTTSKREQITAKTAWEADFSPSGDKSAFLQRQFATMYHILHELRNNKNLSPAIKWARENSSLLEARGSNLEYDLCRLQYISLVATPGAGPHAAITYARETFPRFPSRYAAQTYALLGALAYAHGFTSSPYADLFSSAALSPTSPTAISDTTAAAAAAFTSEFCALLSLSSASPLLTAVTAGCAALPTLLKFNQIKFNARISWTTAGELPVEIPLPPAFRFHSVFVCPVSKEQSTDANPPMMMPCGHVIAKESLEKLSKGSRFKCPYCPAESLPKDAIVVYL